MANFTGIGVTCPAFRFATDGRSALLNRYHLAEVISTSDDPLPSDKAMYAATIRQYEEFGLEHVMSDTLMQLRTQARIVKFAFP